MDVEGLDLPELSTSVNLVVAIVTVAVGLLNCFFGYRIFKFMVGLFGFALGALAGALIAGAVTDGQLLWVALAMLIGGMVGAGLMLLLYFVGVFAAGAAVGAVLVTAIGAGLDVTMPPVVVIVVAIVVGIIALILQRVVIILSTAFSGAWAAVMGGAWLAVGRDLSLVDLVGQPNAWQRADVPVPVVLVVWAVLGIIGTVVQFRTTEDKPAPAPPPEGGTR
jgi:hypothetical protein